MLRRGAMAYASVRRRGSVVRRRIGVVVSLLGLASASSASAQDKGPGDDLSPHPRAAIDTTPSDASASMPFSFSSPLAWPQQTTRIDVSGYLLPQFETISLPSALPRDRYQYGARGSRAGFALHGTPVEGWSYMAHVVVVPAGTESLAILSPTSAPTLSIALPSATGTSIEVEEASASYRPAKWFVGKVGVMRMPFSAAQTTPIPKQMFPFRAAQTSDFQSGADAGFLATIAPLDARLQINVGGFLGSSLGGEVANQTVRGPAIVAQVQAHPLGAMSLLEGDPSRGPFRFALGFASIYRSATVLDATGYEASRFNDARFVAWVRAKVAGVYAQGEYLRRLRTDDLSGRPSISEGGYAQASYFQPIGAMAIGPVLRGGKVTTGIGFAPRTFTSFEGGVAFYPRAKDSEPEKLRILVEYLGASVSPLSEIEREVLAQLQLEF